MATSFIVEFPQSRDTSGRGVITQHKVAVKDKNFEVEPLKPQKQSSKKSEAYLFHTDAPAGKSPWDEAHELFEHYAKAGKVPDYVEPEMEHLLFDPGTLPKARMAGATGFLQNWPQPEGKTDEKYWWHLDDGHSQLMRARKIAEPYFNGKIVKVAHLDTGFDPKHPCKPRNLNLKQAWCFVEGNEGNYAYDVETGTSIEQQWHGTATLAILAGGHVDSFDGKINFGMDFGGAPLAEIVPLRISDTVALLKTASFAKAIEYATDIGCEVVTMSMAGLPSMRWARAVNRAYENGVTIVVAAGNSWVEGPKRFLPKCVLYPGRWERVIAATGISCNHHPYVFDANPHVKPPKQDGFSHSEFMQGNYGPSIAMKTALAAYTPNLPWAARTEEGGWWSLSGGGTSSATPQVAAAAALWVQRFRDELQKSGFAGTWRQVEAVRHGLFNSADKSVSGWDKYYGNGALRAADALDEKWFPKAGDLKMSKPANLFLPFIELFFGSRKALGQEIQEEMFATELLQLAHLNYDLQEILTMDVSEKDVKSGTNVPSAEQMWQLRNALKGVECSESLKAYIGLE